MKDQNNWKKLMSNIHCAQRDLKYRYLIQEMIYKYVYTCQYLSHTDKLEHKWIKQAVWMGENQRNPTSNISWRKNSQRW